MTEKPTDKQTLIQIRRKETYDNARRLLQKYGKVMIVRPTGFGKTLLLAQFLKKDSYKKVLYLYPTQVVKDAMLRFYWNDETKEDIPGVTMMTYARLGRMKTQEIQSLCGFDAIIADEAHKLGAATYSKKFTSLLKINSKAHLIGATATPERMDMADEVSMFFDDHVTSEYTLHDAFSEGVLTKPYYCFCSYMNDIENVRRKPKLDVGTAKNAKTARHANDTLPDAKLIEISRLHNMPAIIQSVCKERIPDTGYMRFIVFFSSFEHLHEKEKDVREWFHRAFPGHKINTLQVTSETKSTKKNAAKIGAMQKIENTIDLILSVDMLEMGYHVPGLNGILMYRGTESGIVYAQQLGRVISSYADNPGVVFDIVDNLHRESVYSVLGKRAKKTVAAKNRYDAVVAKISAALGINPAPEKPFAKPTVFKTGPNAYIFAGVDDNNDFVSRQITDSDITKLCSLETANEINNLYNQFGKNNGKWWLRANDLQPEDLIVDGHEASYRELIGKAVAEARAMRRRQAWARWVEKGGVPEPMTREHILSQQAPHATPLKPFCNLKKVTVQEVLDEMGVA